MRNQRDLVLDWPPILPTRMSAAYCSVSVWTLNRAVVLGQLKPAGVRGRTRVFHRVDLDAWMTGGSPSTDVPLPQADSEAAAGDDQTEGQS